MAKQASTFSRRDFLKLAGKTAAISSGLLMSGCGVSSVSQTGGAASGNIRRTARAIDIHHHYFPMDLVSEIKQHGKALGIEYFPPKDEKASPLQFQFPKGNRLNPDPRLAGSN